MKKRLKILILVISSFLILMLSSCSFNTDTLTDSSFNVSYDNTTYYDTFTVDLYSDGEFSFTCSYDYIVYTLAGDTFNIKLCNQDVDFTYIVNSTEMTFSDYDYTSALDYSISDTTVTVTFPDTLEDFLNDYWSQSNTVSSIDVDDSYYISDCFYLEITSFDEENTIDIYFSYKLDGITLTDPLVI